MSTKDSSLWSPSSLVNLQTHSAYLHEDDLGTCILHAKSAARNSPGVRARLHWPYVPGYEILSEIGSGVIHRDLKPSNVLMSLDGEPKIADFGVAKQLGEDQDASGRCHTVAGTLIGTPEYMAPEQIAGASPAAGMDVYALGVILYELL